MWLSRRDRNPAPEVEAPRRDSGLSKFATCELVEELRRREGVDSKDIEPYSALTIAVGGPAIVLVVID